MNLNLNDKDYVNFLKKESQTKNVHELARELGTYPNRIRRDLIKMGVKTKSHKEVAQLAVDQGKFVSPTLGKKRTQEEKANIGKGISDAYNKLPEKVKKQRKDKFRKLWEQRTEKQINEMRSLAAKALAKTTKDGSKSEILLRDELISRHIRVEFHKTGYLEGNKELDLFLPEYLVAIEIDGPTHFKPLFGQKRLIKTKKYDLEKAGLLNSKGVRVIRVKSLRRSTSKAQISKLADKIQAVLTNNKELYVELEL
jgi:very-short-patch-repair endonuclease